MAREGIWYVSPDSLGDAVAMGSLSMDRKASPYYGLTERVCEFPHTGFSDYSGSAVERSNSRVIREQLGDDAPGIVEFYGAHGSSALAYRCDEHGAPDTGDEEQDAAIRDIVAALSDYPLLDEDDHSALESELVGDAWESYARRDFVRALIEECAGDDDDNRRNVLEDMSAERIDLYYHAAAREASWEYQLETGANVYFNFDEIAPLALEAIFAPG